MSPHPRPAAVRNTAKLCASRAGPTARPRSSRRNRCFFAGNYGEAEWQERRTRAVVAKDASATRLQNFGTANLARSSVAARAAADQLTRALEILAADVPAHLGATARLRIAHPEITLAQLGALCDPPLTKDAVAGRIRRLLALADTRAAALGIPTATG